MKTKNLIIGICLIFVIFSAGCVQNTGSAGSKPSSDEPTDVATSKKTQVIQEETTPATSEASSKKTQVDEEETGTASAEASAKKTQATEEELEETAAAQDKCSEIYENIFLSYTEMEQEADICYYSKYEERAISQKDETLCDEIVRAYQLGRCYASVAIEKKVVNTCSKVKNIEYTAKGYYDDLSSRDICYSKYAHHFIDNYIIYVGEACNNIQNQQLQEKCVDYKQYMKPAEGINSVYAAGKSTGVDGYFILANDEGYAATDDGTVEIIITGEAGERLYSKTVHITREDFIKTVVGIGAYARYEILYSISLIKYSEFYRQPTPNERGEMTIRFTTMAGKTFEDTGTIYFE